MFAERLKELRKDKNMTQVQLAEALGKYRGKRRR
jgi:transcriptional regulator with XRE-family HTH domain